MTKDLYGLDLTVGQAQTLDRYNAFAATFARRGAGASAIFAAADADQDAVFVNAQAAALHMASEAAPAFKLARGYLRRARKFVRQATKREQAFVTAVGSWWRGDLTGALKRLRTLCAEHPADLVSAVWASYLAGTLGDTAALYDIAKGAVAAHDGAAQAWSLLAAAQAANGAHAEAERSARRAMTLEPSDPLAHQVLAMVFELQGRFDEGVALLTMHSPDWSECEASLRERNYGLLASFHLQRGEVERALEIFDRHLWRERRDAAAAQVTAVSALWQLELAGVDVGRRWDPIVAKVTERWHEHIVALNDLHFVMALARCGRRRETDDFIASMIRHGEKDVTGVWESVAIPCALGLVAFAERRFTAAGEHIAPVLQRLALVGGSAAQRQVIVRTYHTATRLSALPAQRSASLAA